MFKKMSLLFINKAEKRIGVSLDYVRNISSHSMRLFFRYNRIFGFLDPNKNCSALAYHAARIRGALAADCGTCVEAEINLAKNAGISKELISAIIHMNYEQLNDEIISVIKLSNAVTAKREDDEESRNKIVQEFGEKGLIEICFAMNGAALLPGIKRGMGFATTCDLSLFKR